MTDREKLIELLGGDMCKDVCCYDCEYENNDRGCIEHIKQNMADHLIAYGVTFAKDTNVPSWIPVSERLPEPFELVYVYVPEEKRVTDAYMTRHKEWVGVRMNCEVTHWMPLSEPPKED